MITRQRDLLDRGLVNVLTHNDSGHDVLITDRELVADFFDGSPAELRTTSVRDGRQIAIQVPYGVADDCTTDAAVSAELVFTYTTGAVATPRSVSVPVGGTDILDGIHAKQCAARTFDEATDVRFENTQILDGMLVTDLVIDRTGGASTVAVEGSSGTILVDARIDERGVVLAETDTTTTIPLTFVVNRCDPHALAEVTKRYGLDLHVSIDGAVSQPIPIDVTTLIDDLEAIVQLCRDSSLTD